MMRRCSIALGLLVGCHREPPPVKVVVEPAHASPARVATPPAATVPTRPVHRFIAPPGPGPALQNEWYEPPIGLGTMRLALTNEEAIAIEARLRTWSQNYGSRVRFDARVPSELMLFEKIGSSTGDKVAIRGFNGIPLEHDGNPMTLEALRSLLVFDGGCTVWRALYDVRTQSFESVECNGQA